MMGTMRWVQREPPPQAGALEYFRDPSVSAARFTEQLRIAHGMLERWHSRFAERASRELRAGRHHRPTNDLPPTTDVN